MQVRDYYPKTEISRACANSAPMLIKILINSLKGILS